LYILLKRQKSLEISNISENHLDILWINLSAPSLGDSLMDLSSRKLLHKKNIDLFTDKKNAHIFSNDVYFSAVYVDIKDVINKKKYDLVIIDSYSSRSVLIKSKIAALVPYVSMYGYFNGPQVNRVLFSFHQMNRLLGYINTEKDINIKAKSSMTISMHDQKLVNGLKLPKEFITIVLGGDWSYRTYNNWCEVIERLFCLDHNIQIALVGSENAKNDEKKIFEKLSSYKLFSFVAKYSFTQTAQILSKSSLVFCCDGGLMHAANSLGVKVIPLLAKLDASMQLTESCKSFPLFDLLDVNNILVEDIIQKYSEAASFDHNHLLS
jgi:heptosyltransferase-2